MLFVYSSMCCCVLPSVLLCVAIDVAELPSPAELLCAIGAAS